MTLKDVLITCKEVGFFFLLIFLVLAPTVSSGVKRYIASKFGSGCRTFDISSTTKKIIKLTLKLITWYLQKLRNAADPKLDTTTYEQKERSLFSYAPTRTTKIKYKGTSSHK